jgi:hypothetical protein
MNVHSTAILVLNPGAKVLTQTYFCSFEVLNRKIGATGWLHQAAATFSHQRANLQDHGF